MVRQSLMLSTNGSASQLCFSLHGTVHSPDNRRTALNMYNTDIVMSFSPRVSFVTYDPL